MEGMLSIQKCPMNTIRWNYQVVSKLTARIRKSTGILKHSQAKSTIVFNSYTISSCTQLTQQRHNIFFFNTYSTENLRILVLEVPVQQSHVVTKHFSVPCNASMLSRRASFRSCDLRSIAIRRGTGCYTARDANLVQLERAARRKKRFATSFRRSATLYVCLYRDT